MVTHQSVLREASVPKHRHWLPAGVPT